MAQKTLTPDWLNEEEVKSLILALGFERARFVGGCVRDTVLGRPVNDIDVATTLAPEQVMERLKLVDFNVIPTGIKHGTITGIKNHQHFEITTLRLDVETDGRHATVAYHDDWEADAARRDFTMNALYLEADGTLHDYFDGVKDAKAGAVKFIGNAADRIDEDALRILRLFRFWAHIGKGALDAQILKIIKKQSGLLTILSVERIRDELIKLLKAPNPVPALLAMKATNVLSHVLPECQGFDRLEKLVGVDAPVDKGGNTIDPLLRLSTLLPHKMGPARAASKRLKLSNAQQNRLIGLVYIDGTVVPTVSDIELGKILFNHGHESAIAFAWLNGNAGDGEAIASFVDRINNTEAPVVPLRGQDLLDEGFEPGQALGELMASLERKWFESDFQLTREDLLQIAKGGMTLQ